jgi:uncharacterized phiE125 gp8 family phage protein
MKTLAKVIAPPTVEPVTIEEARAHLEAQRYGDTSVDDADDAMIMAWVGAARAHCEEFLALSLAPTELEIALDAWPQATGIAGVAIELPRGPVREVLYITAGDPTSSSDNELDPADYVLDTFGILPRVLPVGSWPGTPTVPGGVGAIRVRYAAGYASPDEPSSSDANPPLPLPPAIRAAILLMLGHLYETREAVNADGMTTVPLGVDALLRPLRVRLGMA